MRARTRWVVLGAALVVAVTAALVAWPHVQEYVGTSPPAQFVSPLDPTPPINERPTLGVAHNAGNHPTTTATAITHGAAVIEIDVISVRGELVAGRVQPWRWLADRVFRGPTLAEAWQYASDARIVKLDLQENDPALLRQVVAFLDEQPASRRVMVSTRDPDALLYLRPRLPHVTLLFSAAFPDAIRQIRTDPSLQAAIDGVSVFEGLATSSFVGWAHQHHLVVLAWTVNDGRRLNQLLAIGVDGITTQNLAVLDALSFGG